MLRLIRSVRGMAHGQQVMPVLYFLQKEYVGLYLRQRLFQRMYARPVSERRNSFVNIVSGEAQFHGSIRLLG